MRAIHATESGPPSVLQLVELPDPTPGAGEIAIDVTHAAVGRIDAFARQGVFAQMFRAPFVPGLEVAGRVRALGAGVTRFSVGEDVVAFSGTGTGGYAAIRVIDQARVVSLRDTGITPAHAVAVIPDAAMAHVALTRVARLGAGESVLIIGALGGFASVFPGIARQLGAARVVGAVRGARRDSRLPYDRIVPIAELAGETFDVVVDPVGGAARTAALGLLAPFGRLIVVGNASGDWDHTLPSNPLWIGNATVSGFNAGGYFAARPDDLGPGIAAAITAARAGLLDVDIDVLPLADAARAHERLERGGVVGRLLLAP